MYMISLFQVLFFALLIGLCSVKNRKEELQQQ